MTRKRDGVYFLTRLLLFMGPIVLCLTYIESRLEQIPNTYSVKRQNLERQLAEVNVLVLGNSWAAAGIDPACFRVKGYNLAFGGQSLWYDAALTRKYVGRMPALKTVIIALSYFSLGYELDESVERWREAFYWRVWGIQPRTAHLTYWDRKLRYSLMRLYDKERVLTALLKNFDVDFNAAWGNGWVSGTGAPEEISESSGMKRVKVHDNMIKDRNYGANGRELASLLADLTARGVHVIFVTPPVFESYYKHTQKAIRARNDQLVKALCERYGCGYFDYLDDKRFQRTDFSNNDHLNRQGAEKFSGILDAEVIASVETHPARSAVLQVRR